MKLLRFLPIFSTDQYSLAPADTFKLFQVRSQALRFCLDAKLDHFFHELICHRELDKITFRPRNLKH